MRGTLTVMTERSFWNRPAAGWIGLGFMFAWRSSLLYWLEWAQSATALASFAGYVGIVMTSAAMLGVALYMGHLSSELKRLKDRLGEQQVQHYC